MRRHSRVPDGSLRLTLLSAAMAVASGCGVPPATPAVPIPTVEATAVASLAPAQFAESRKFRETLGLRADDLWISIVSADPSSQEGTKMFDVPLMPWELRQLLARESTAVDAGAVIIEYGLTVPDDWHGSYIDQKRGAIVVAEFYRNADRHRAAIARLLSPAARWEVREVDPLVLDQIAFVERVKDERAWFETIDAELLDVVTNPMDGGIVELTYKAVRRDLDVAIREHFGGPDWLRVDWAGAPPWTGPLGDLVILAVDAQGRPVPGLLCSFGEGTGLVTAPDGTCRYPGAAATETTVRLMGGIDSEGSSYVAGSATFTVVANRLTSVRIVVHKP